MKLKQLTRCEQCEGVCNKVAVQISNGLRYGVYECSACGSRFLGEGVPVEIPVQKRGLQWPNSPS